MAKIYDYYLDPVSKTYRFTTDHEVEFKIVFARDRSWFPYNPEYKDVFTFDVAATPPSKHQDNRIRVTIVEILSKRIYDNPNTIVTYHCDNEDGKGKLRDRKFDSWYQLVDQTIIHKYDRQVIYRDELFYSSLILHQDNPLYKRAVEIYYAGDMDVTDKFDI